jgi:hypothetical protein
MRWGAFFSEAGRIAHATAPWICVEIVVGFHEKASINAPGVISSGIYVFDRDVFSFLTAEISRNDCDLPK